MVSLPRESPLDAEFSNSARKHGWIQWLGWEQEFNVVDGLAGVDKWHKLLVAGRAPAYSWGGTTAHTLAERNEALCLAGGAGIGLVISAFEPKEFEVDTAAVKPQKPEMRFGKAHMGGIPLHRHPIVDKTDNLGIKGKRDDDFAQMRETVRLMDACVCEGKRVHVSCKAGVGRTAVILAAYLVTFGGLDVDQAADVLRRSRWIVSLTTGRRAQLGGFRDWWKEHHQAADESVGHRTEMGDRFTAHQDAVATPEPVVASSHIASIATIVPEVATVAAIQLTWGQWFAQLFTLLFSGQQQGAAADVALEPKTASPQADLSAGSGSKLATLFPLCAADSQPTSRPRSESASTVFAVIGNGEDSDRPDSMGDIGAAAA